MTSGYLASARDRHQSGAATVEYLVVGLFVIFALLAGPDVIHLVWSALHKAYTAFYYAISVGV